MIASFVFAFSVYAVNGYAVQREREQRREAVPAEAAADEDERRAGRARRRRSTSRAQRAASPTSRSSRRSRSPGRTRDTRRGRRCHRARSPPRSARSSGCAREPDPPRPSARTARGPSRCGMFPYGASPSRILLAPTTPARPTSITPRGASRLRPTRKPSRKTAAAASTHVGQTERSGLPRLAEPDPEPAREEVEQNRVDERDARKISPAVEERERDREAEEHEQVERSAPRAAAAGPRGRRGRRGRSRSRRTGSGASCPPNAPVAAARHLPRDLRPGPCLGDAPGRVLDDGLRDLTRLARPRLHDPRARLLAEAPVRRRDRAGSARARRRSSDARAPTSTASSSVRRGGSLGSAGSAGASARSARSSRASGRDESGRREDGQRAQRRGPNDQSLLPTKFTGVTSTIAIACATTSPSPSVTSRCSTARFATSASGRDDEEPRALVRDAAPLRHGTSTDGSRCSCS